jgi:vitamin B12 transporter
VAPSPAHSLTKYLKAFADLKNLTNQKYFDILGFNSRRFNFMAGITIHL